MSGETVIVTQDEDGDWELSDEDSQDVDAIADDMVASESIVESVDRSLSPMQSKILESWKDYP